MDEQSKLGRPSNDQNDQHLLGHLKEFWNDGVSNYTKSFRKLQVLDQTDRGELWKAIWSKVPTLPGPPGHQLRHLRQEQHACQHLLRIQKRRGAAYIRS